MRRGVFLRLRLTLACAVCTYAPRGRQWRRRREAHVAGYAGMHAYRLAGGGSGGRRVHCAACRTCYDRVHPLLQSLLRGRVSRAMQRVSRPMRSPVCACMFACTHVYVYVHVCHACVRAHRWPCTCVQPARRKRMRTGGKGEADWQKVELYVYVPAEGERNLTARAARGAGYRVHGPGPGPPWQLSSPISDSHHSGAHQQCAR